MLMYQPATRWQDATPCGNGILGALVYGHIRNEVIVLNHDSLFLRSPKPRMNPVNQYLSEFRKMLMEGRYREGTEFFIEKLKENYFGEEIPDPYQPVFDIRIDTETTGAPVNYKRTLDFQTGESIVQWQEYNEQFYRKLFVSRADDAIVIKIGTTKEQGVNCQLALMPHDSEDVSGMGSGQDIEGNKLPFSYETYLEEDYITLKAKYPNGDEFGGIAKLAIRGGEAKAYEDSLHIQGADEVLVVIKLYVNEEGSHAIKRLHKELSQLHGGYDMLFERHADLHGELFNRSSLNLGVGDTEYSNEELLLRVYKDEFPPELIQRMFDFGRYLLISSSRPGGLPANLQGLWNGDYNPAWSSDYHNDENIQMNYWAALPGNLAETALPYFDYYESMLDDFRANARSVYGCRGIFIPIAQTTHGLLYGSSIWAAWTAGAGWIAQLFYDYWLFSGDKDFLKNRAIPFLKEVALFYEDFLIEDDDGKLMFIPSLSPENIPSIPEATLITINATMDIAVAKEVLTNLCNGCELLGIEEEGVKRWREILAKLPSYEINEDGAIKEWVHPKLTDNYHHRHQSHIYPLFPGFEITEENDPKLFEAINTAVEKRLVVGMTSQTGWSYAHMANIYARLGNGNRALECLELLCRSCLGPNLFTYHNDWRSQGLSMFWGHGIHPPFQIDANFGLTAAVLEMLVFSAPGIIKLLPALPNGWAKGKINGVLCRGGIEVDIRWDMEEGQMDVDLISLVDQCITVKFPVAPRNIVCRIEDAEISSSDFGENYRNISLRANKKIQLMVTLDNSN